jgi:hypothetical protein
MLKTINAILTIPGAAPVMAAKIIGRVIGQVANGFGKDEQLESEISVYKAIAVKYPADTISLPDMFKTMLRRANTEVETADFSAELEGMSEEQKALWDTPDADLSERDQMLAAMPEMTTLFGKAPVDIKAWLDLPTIAQWSLLNAVEQTLPNKVSLYKSWADRDRTAGKASTNAMRLESEAEAAIPTTFKIITEFLDNKDVAKDLDTDREHGIAVPVRNVA